MIYDNFHVNVIIKRYPVKENYKHTYSVRRNDSREVWVGNARFYYYEQLCAVGVYCTR